MNTMEASRRSSILTRVGEIIPLQFGDKRHNGVPWMSIWGQRDSGLDFFEVDENPDITRETGQVGLYEIVEVIEHPVRDQADICVRLVEYIPTFIKAFFVKDDYGRPYAIYRTSARTKMEIVLVPAFRDLQERYHTTLPVFKEFSLHGEAGEWTVRPVKVVSPGPIRLAVVFANRGHKFKEGKVARG